MDQKDLSIPINSISLPAILSVQEGIKGLVIFAHGSGSSRFSTRNQYVAGELNDANFGTLLFDLLTPEEDEIKENRFDIALLSDRLRTVTKWAIKEFKNLPIGYFGASTGAASALEAAADIGLRKYIKAVVSRGGRPDLAMPFVDKIAAATLLIVGELDETVIELNREVYHLLPGIKDLNIISGATHLFEEPGKLEMVAALAANWFKKHLR